MRWNQTLGKYKLTRKNWIEFAVMTIIFAIAAILVYKTTILTRMIMPRAITQVKPEEGCSYVLSDGDHIEQTFLYASEELLSAGTMISLDEDVLEKLVSKEKDLDLGEIHLEILDDTGSMLMSADYDVCLLADGQNLVASLPVKEGGWKGRKLTIVLDVSGINEELGLEIGYTAKQVAGTQLAINGQETDFTLNIQTADHQFPYWKEWSVFGAVLLYFLVAGTYLLLAVVRIKPEKVFLFSGTILSLVYLLLIPPLAVPDEEVHFKEAYYYANQIMGKEKPQEGEIIFDLEDFHAMQKFETTPSLSEYDILKDHIGKKGREEGTETVERDDTHAPAVTYLPGIVGIIVGRVCGLNGLLVIYLGRICSIGCYLFMMYWFIRLMPFAKASAFIMSILPMTIQQCCSYSYDSVVIEVAFLYLAILFGLLYKEKTIEKWQIMLYIVCMIMLSICKGGTYMPLCLLTMLIPVSRFKDRKQKWIFVGSMAALAVIAFLSSTLGYALYVASPTAEQAADSYLAGEAFGAAGLLANPWTFICLSARTFFLSGDVFLEMMLGMQLGWLDISVSRIAVYGLLLLMILSVLQTENVKDQQGIEVTVMQKVSYLTVGALSVGMVFASLFMSWTPKNSITIAGIQGRYFLPLLPIFLLLFRNKNVIVKRDMSAKLMFLAVSMQYIAIYGILMSLERIL